MCNAAEQASLLTTGPGWFDWLSLGVALVAGAVPVVITLWLWRKDHRTAEQKLALAAREAEQSAAQFRRSEIQRRFGDLLSAELDALLNDDLGRFSTQKHRLMSAITAIAQEPEYEAVRWIQATSLEVLSVVTFDLMFTAPNGRRDISAADDVALRSMTPVEAWVRDPSSVDFLALRELDEWASLDS